MNKVVPYNTCVQFDFLKSEGDPLSHFVEKIRDKESFNLEAVKKLATNILEENETVSFPPIYWEEEVRPAILTGNATKIQVVAYLFYEGEIPGLDESQKSDLAHICLRKFNFDISRFPEKNLCCVIS